MRPYKMTVITSPMTFMAKVMTQVSSMRANNSPSSMASSWVVILARADVMSMAALVLMTPALLCTIVWAT